MKIETETSKYKLRLDTEARELVLKKTKIKRGKTSAIPKEEEFRGTKVEISNRGHLILYQGEEPVLRTSRLKDL